MSDIKKVINKYLKDKKKEINLSKAQEEKIASYMKGKEPAKVEIIAQHPNGDVVIDVTIKSDKTWSGKLTFVHIVTKRGKVKH